MSGLARWWTTGPTGPLWQSWKCDPECPETATSLISRTGPVGEVTINNWLLLQWFVVRVELRLRVHRYEPKRCRRRESLLKAAARTIGKRLWPVSLCSFGLNQAFRRFCMSMLTICNQRNATILRLRPAFSKLGKRFHIHATGQAHRTHYIGDKWFWFLFYYRQPQTGGELHLKNTCLIKVFYFNVHNMCKSLIFSYIFSFLPLENEWMVAHYNYIIIAISPTDFSMQYL